MRSAITRLPSNPPFCRSRAGLSLPFAGGTLASRQREPRSMPKFAANLSMMFQEIPSFLDRFDAAAKAGFKGVEFLFPYDYPPEAIAEKLEKNGLTLALFNLPPGDWAKGERGFAALPGRQQAFMA